MIKRAPAIHRLYISSHCLDTQIRHGYMTVHYHTSPSDYEVGDILELVERSGFRAVRVREISHCREPGPTATSCLLLDEISYVVRTPDRHDPATHQLYVSTQCFDDEIQRGHYVIRDRTPEFIREMRASRYQRGDTIEFNEMDETRHGLRIRTVRILDISFSEANWWPFTTALTFAPYSPPYNLGSVSRPDDAAPEDRVPMTHRLKTWPGPFGVILSGAKRYEIRPSDRDFRVGDLLELIEWLPDEGVATGRAITARVTYLTPGGEWGLPAHCVMSIDVVPVSALRAAELALCRLLRRLCPR